MYSKRLFCLKRVFLVVVITLVLINFHIVINNPNSLQNIFDNGVVTKFTSSSNKTNSGYIPTKEMNKNETGISNIEMNEYSVVELDPSTKYVRSYIRGENIQYSKKVTAEYIDKLKNTNQCQRMWMKRKDESRPSIMATFSRGRLANQLNSFAYQYAIWKELGLYSYLDSFQLKLLNNVFEFPDPGMEDSSIYFEWKEGCLRNNVTTVIRPKWQVLKQQYHFNNDFEEEEYFKRIDNKIEDLKHNKYVKLPFYTVDIKRFFPYVDELRSNVLKFKPDTISKSQNIMKNMKEKYAKEKEISTNDITTVSIHIRLTDYKKHLSHNYNMSTASEEYLNKAINFMSNKYKNALFYVLSDDLIAARKIFNQEMRKEFYIAFPGNSQTPYPGLDMALLSLADHSILSYGTFGMWGALLAGDGEVTLPKDIVQTDVGMAMRRAKISTWTFL